MGTSRQILNARRKVVEARESLKAARVIISSTCPQEFHEAEAGVDKLDVELQREAGRALAKEDDEAPRDGSAIPRNVASHVA